MTDFDPIDPKELIAELALGVLDEAEAARVRAYLAQNPEAALEYEEMARVARILPLAVQEREPSEALRSGLMDRIASEPTVLRPKEPADVPSRTRKPIAWLFPLAAAAAVLVVAAGFGGFALGRSDDDSGDIRAQAAMQDRLLSAVAHGEARTASGGEGDLRVAVVHSQGSEDAYTYVQGLPVLESGKAYQAWFTKDLKTFEPGPTFHTKDGSVWLEASDDVSSYVAMAFTVEKDGGVQQPTQAPFVVVPLAVTAMR